MKENLFTDDVILSEAKNLFADRPGTNTSFNTVQCGRVYLLFQPLSKTDLALLALPHLLNSLIKLRESES